MALTANKIVYYGPFQFDIKASAVSKYARTALKPDSLVLNIETKKGNSVFEDGTEEDWEEGRKLVGTLTLSEFDTADQALVEDGDNMVVTMDNGAVLTFGATCRFFVDVQAGKTVITFWKTVALGNDISDVVAIS